MKKHLKKLLFIVSCLGFIFSGCEKDLYENPIKDAASVNIGKVNTVSINEVPFLIPQLAKYNSRYSHLLNSDSQNSHRGIEDLDLELERILEYAETNGLKSYSIAIKNEFNNADDMYFENLHIIYVDGEYKPFIARYNATDDSEKFDVATFSGRIKLFSVDKLTVGSLYFVNGQKHPDPAPYNPLDGDIGIGGGGDPPSWMPDWLVSIFYHWNGNYLGSNSSSSSSSSSSGGNSGTGVYILGTGYTNVGSTTNTPTVNTSGSSGSGTNSTGVAPNEPEWTYPLTSQLAMANKIRSRLIYSNPEFEPWLENPSNLNLVDQLYFYMAEGGNDSETNNVASSALVQMIANPGVFTSMTPFIIEQQINVDAVDPCTKAILNSLKNLQQNDMAKIFAKLNNPNFIQKPTYSTTFALENPSNPDAFATTNWDLSAPFPSNTPLPFNYIIKIRPSYLNGTFLGGLPPTKLSIARTLLHEIIHAYFDSLFDDCYYYGNCTSIKQFPDLWSDYEHRYLNIPNSTTVTDPQHLTIANNFVTILASALQEYQTGVPVAINTQPEQVYKDLAWQGLQGSNQNPIPAFNLAYPPGSDARLRWFRTNNAEDSQTNSDATGNLPIIGPISNPCN